MLYKESYSLNQKINNANIRAIILFLVNIFTNLLSLEKSLRKYKNMKKLNTNKEERRIIKIKGSNMNISKD